MTMQRRLLIACGLSILVMGALFALYPVMARQLQEYIRLGADLPLSVRILYSLSLFWRTFWWFLTPFILLASYGGAMLLERLFFRGR
jgi:hypothetical protein